MSSLTAESSPIAETLRRSKIHALRRVGAAETVEEVVLTGSVPSYYLKQLAQEAVLPLCGGRRLVNRVEVVRATKNTHHEEDE
jgi:hypothetical protein